MVIDNGKKDPDVSHFSREFLRKQKEFEEEILEPHRDSHGYLVPPDVRRLRSQLPTDHPVNLTVTVPNRKEKPPAVTSYPEHKSRKEQKGRNNKHK